MTVNDASLKFANALKARKTTTHIVLHHSGTTSGTIQSFHDYHINHNKWAGIGYHFVVYKNGEVWRGRPENTQGAHAPAVNSVSIGICFVGNYESESEMPIAQINAGHELLEYLKGKYYGLIVVKHKDVTNTTCPGRHFPFDKIISGAVAGDLDGDGNVTSSDALLALQHTVGLTDVDENRGDMDGDGKVDSGDALEMLQESVGLNNPPAPVTPATPKNTFPGAERFGKGKTNDYILMLDKALIAHGYAKYYKYGANGASRSWGNGTSKACRAFQLAQGWSGKGADGIPGPETWKRLGL